MRSSMSSSQAFGRTAGVASAGSLRKGANFNSAQASRIKTFGSNADYNSIHQMQFRGQEKRTPQPGVLGGNPNEDAADEYIVNLQQQIHFMTLELKILKEKVYEDQAKSGIGSLYDDEKSSHQHISLLKTKYAKMRKDFDREMQELSKSSLKIKGQGFVLDSQIKIIKEQMQKLKTMEADFTDQANEDHQEFLMTNKQNFNQQMTLEGDMRNLNDNLSKTEKIHYEHKIFQDKEVTFDNVGQQRHDQEIELYTALKKRKEKELADLKAALIQLEKDFNSMKDYQNALAETENLRIKIEAAKVKTQFLEIQILVLSDTVDFLKTKQEDLEEEKKLAELKNEELSTQLKAKEEIDKKRLQNKLNREKSVEVKELLAADEIAKHESDEINQKLINTRDQYDNLLKDKIELEETCKRQTEELVKDTEIVEDQDKLLAELKRQVEAEQAEVEALEEAVDTAKQIQREEEDRHRRAEQENTALRAKLVFIEANYDYTSTAETMNMDIFNQIVRSNKNMNETVEGFVEQVQDVKKEVSTIIARKNVIL